MFKNYCLAIKHLLSLTVLLVPGMLFAQGSTDPSGPATNANETLSVQLVNPIKVDSIQELLQTILEIVIILATPIVVLFIIYAGFKYVTARGNASQIQEATQALTYAVIGGVLIIGAVAIAEIIKNLVTSFQ
jgi:Type IV secretion system pilin